MSQISQLKSLGLESYLQVRINEEKEMKEVLVALTVSQPADRFPRDLAVVNFGLHYKPDQKLRDDVTDFFNFWAASKVILSYSL